MICLMLLVAVLCGLSTPALSAQLSPGDTPVLVLTDGQSLAAPTGSGPFDNSAVLHAPSGTGLAAELEYVPYAPPSNNVLWGLLLSAQQTPLPTNLLPPPLFTQPPFLLIFPTLPTLDVNGMGSLPLAVPAGLYDGTIYAQAILADLSAPPGGSLRLSNGVRVDVVPPTFNVRLSYVRATPALGVPDLSGVGHADLDAALMTTLPPFGASVPPVTADDPVGLPQGFEFLHVLSNLPDAPINPLALPMTRIAAPVTASQEDNVFEVEDTTGFAPSGKLIVTTTVGVTNGFSPWASKGGADKLPKVEVVEYLGKTATTFFGLKRKRVGSYNDAGNPEHPHQVGDLVLGEFSVVTTSAALSRERVSLDARNPDMIHVVIPAFSFTPSDPGAAEVSMDLDLYRYQDSETGEQGFCVLDRVSQEWRVIGDTLVDTTDGTRRWNPMVSIAPDGRSMLAAVTVEAGDLFNSAADELWAIRLDGLDWPASGSEAWQIDYELVADPVAGDTYVRGREVYMPSVAIAGTGPDDLVGFVGLSYKFAQSPKGQNVAQAAIGAPILGYEGTYLREQNIVADYIDVPLVAPGSGDALPASPRPFLIDSFPNTGSGASLIRFDPQPLRAPDGRSIYLVGGAAASEGDEDLYRISNVGVSAAGAATYSLRNLTGHGSGGGAGISEIRAFDQGGHGVGQKVALSPLGTRVAFLVEDIEKRRDWIHIARTNGADFAIVDHIYEDGGSFQEPGPFTLDNSVVGMHWIDEERLAFLMGRSFYDSPMAFALPVPGDYIAQDPESQLALDVFVYDLSTDEMVNVTNTGGSANGFGALGTIQPAAVFLSPNRDFYYVLRDGEPSQGNTVLEPGVEVMNILGVDLNGLTAFDVTGDELGTMAQIPNLDLPRFDGEAPIETLAAMNFVQGSGVQQGMLFFSAHKAGDGSQSDTLVGFNADVPFLGLTVAPAAGQGTHISNVTPSPDQTLVAFARTFDSDPLSVTQHPFVADLSAFGFVRDLTPALLDLEGHPFGRFMDGSFQYLPAGQGAGTALCFVMGLDADEGSGVARQTAPAYYPLANVSNLLLEPEAVLLPLLTTNNLGPNNRIYLQAARLSTGEP